MAELSDVEFLAVIDEVLAQLHAGEGIPLKEVERLLSQWDSE